MHSARSADFIAGLERLGFVVELGLPPVSVTPSIVDIFVTWNRIGQADQLASRFHRVIVAENALWGNAFAGDRWVYLARDYHNLNAGFPVGGQERWDSLGVELEPFRTWGDEIVLLAQRGIGPARTASPLNWSRTAAIRFGGRVRRHPGNHPECAVPLRDDLARASRVVTWSSGAAVSALQWGIPVTSMLPGWAAEQDNTVAGRLAMFRRLAWAHARMSEIRSGEALERLL